MVAVAVGVPQLDGCEWVQKPERRATEREHRAAHATIPSATMWAHAHTLTSPLSMHTGGECRSIASPISGPPHELQIVGRGLVHHTVAPKLLDAVFNLLAAEALLLVGPLDERFVRTVSALRLLLDLLDQVAD